jgi:hypothetical protein
MKYLLVVISLLVLPFAQAASIRLTPKDFAYGISMQPQDNDSMQQIQCTAQLQ